MVVTTNNDIRLEAAGAGVRLWQIADKLDVSDATLFRWLRHELPDRNKERIRAIIAELAEVQ